ncbi:hypothetical protein CASFOL_017496 [Castilleja foliolosa]|uniref:Methyltransferase domain-containing protein n=1 Tax=Castilleja foliolosa TaxID=1961234 RepID=A0ABD3DEK7_9LAMI
MDWPEPPKCDVAPATVSEYLDPHYWDRRFAQEEHYEWFKDYSHFRHLILQHIKQSITSGLKTTLISVTLFFNTLNPAPVLEVGCGNSQLCEELYKDGITELTCIDLSSVAVDQARAATRHGKISSLFIF